MENNDFNCNKLTFTNQKGGIGKTALSTNVARILSKNFKKKVLFIDLDVQGNATETLSSFNSCFTTYDLIHRDLTDEELVRVDMTTQENNLIISKSSNSLADADRFDLSDTVNYFQKNIQKLSNKFDFLVIDTPPTLGNSLFIALSVSQFLIIPVELDSFSLQGLNKVFETYNSMKKLVNKDLELLGIVINKLASSRKRQEELLQYIKEKGLKDYLFESMIHSSASIQDALSKSCSLEEIGRIKNSTDRRALKEFRALTREVLDKIELFEEKV